MTPERRTILVLFAIALGLRVLYAAFASTQPDIITGAVTGDLLYAREIVAGLDWIKTPYSPLAPGYPALLAILYLLAFKQLWLVLFYQSALGAATVLVLHRMGVDLLGKTMGLVAAVWFAGAVLHMQYTSLFTRDALAVFLLLLLLFFVIRPLRRMRFGLFTGIVYAALVHVDPQFVLLFPLLAVFILFFKSRHNILNLQYFFLFTAAVFLVSVPWAVRNQVVYRQAVPIALEASKYFRPFKVFTTEADKTVSQIERKISSASRSRRVQTNTTEFWRVTRTGESSVTPTGDRPPAEPAWSLRHNLISAVSYGLLLPFFLLGIILAVRTRNRTALMIVATALYYFLMRAYLGGSERARLVADPLIVLVAFYGVLFVTRRMFSFPRPDGERGQQSSRRSRPVISGGTSTPM
ncbi:MAG: glycosyltransferase family 39 protein [Candidatus Krumholzibacteriia bacterium]